MQQIMQKLFGPQTYVFRVEILVIIAVLIFIGYIAHSLNLFKKG